MTKQELENLLKNFGSKGKQIAAQVHEKVEQEKEQLDTDTRRKVRSFWIAVSVIAFAAGAVVGHLFW